MKKKTKKRLSRKVEAGFDVLRAEVSRVLIDLARQLERAAGMVSGKAQQARPALTIKSTGPCMGTATPSDSAPGDTMPSASSSVSSPVAGGASEEPSSMDGASEPELADRGGHWIRFEVQSSTAAAEVRIVGNHPALGDWIPERGLVLDESAPKTWTGRAHLPGGAFGLEYKYVRRSRDGSFSWEALRDNRTFAISSTGGDRLIRDEARWTG